MSEITGTGGVFTLDDDTENEDTFTPPVQTEGAIIGDEFRRKEAALGFLTARQAIGFARAKPADLTTPGLTSGEQFSLGISDMSTAVSVYNALTGSNELGQGTIDLDYVRNSQEYLKQDERLVDAYKEIVPTIFKQATDKDHFINVELPKSN